MAEVESNTKQVDDRRIFADEPEFEFVMQLKISDQDDQGRTIWHDGKTLVELYGPVADIGDSKIYVSGLEIANLDLPWDVNLVGDPINPAFPSLSCADLRRLTANIFNRLYWYLPKERLFESWVDEAVSSRACHLAPFKYFLNVRFGRKRVAFDPDRSRFNRRARENDYAVVKPKQLTYEAWCRATYHGLIEPAARHFGW